MSRISSLSCGHYLLILQFHASPSGPASLCTYPCIHYIDHFPTIEPMHHSGFLQSTHSPRYVYKQLICPILSYCEWRISEPWHSDLVLIILLLTETLCWKSFKESGLALAQWPRLNLTLLATKFSMKYGCFRNCFMMVSHSSSLPLSLSLSPLSLSSSIAHTGESRS